MAYTCLMRLETLVRNIFIHSDVNGLTQTLFLCLEFNGLFTSTDCCTRLT